MRTITLLLITAVALGKVLMIVSPRDVEGSVKDVLGRPVIGASIKTSFDSGHQITDERGRFVLSHLSPVLHVFHPTLGGQTYVIDTSVSRVDLVLEDHSTMEWRLRQCPIGVGKTIEVGNYGFLLPPQVAYDQVIDADYQVTTVWIDGKENGGKLRISFSLDGSELGPKDDWFIHSRRYSQRTWAFKDEVGVDYSGEMPDGLYWRWTDLSIGGKARYENATKGEAVLFDTVIDSLCRRSQ